MLNHPAAPLTRHFLAPPAVRRRSPPPRRSSSHSAKRSSAATARSARSAPRSRDALLLAAHAARSCLPTAGSIPHLQPLYQGNRLHCQADETAFPTYDADQLRAALRKTPVPASAHPHLKPGPRDVRSHTPASLLRAIRAAPAGASGPPARRSPHRAGASGPPARRSPRDSECTGHAGRLGRAAAGPSHRRRAPEPAQRGAF